MAVPSSSVGGGRDEKRSPPPPPPPPCRGLSPQSQTHIPDDWSCDREATFVSPGPRDSGLNDEEDKEEVDNGEGEEDNGEGEEDNGEGKMGRMGTMGRTRDRTRGRPRRRRRPLGADWRCDAMSSTRRLTLRVRCKGGSDSARGVRRSTGSRRS
ncbi:unnamed protein product [Lampetra planeri]